MSEVIVATTSTHSKSNSLEKLENEIKQVVSNCQSLISYKDTLKKEGGCHKDNGSTNSTFPESKSSLALEKVS